jgi:hypothetical protein
LRRYGSQLGPTFADDPKAISFIPEAASDVTLEGRNEEQRRKAANPRDQPTNFATEKPLFHDEPKSCVRKRPDTHDGQHGPQIRTSRIRTGRRREIQSTA